VSRRQLPRERIERRGRWARVGPAWSAEDLATLRHLVEGGCITKDIALHFNSTPTAISALMHRHRILRRHPTVAEVLKTVAPSESSTPAASGSASVATSGHQAPEMAGGGSTLYPVVEIIDRFEKHVCEVELREIDERRQCRVVRRHGDKAGQWATFPLWQIRFYAGTDRKQAIEAARQRGQHTAERRAERHSKSETPAGSESAHESVRLSEDRT